MAESTSSSSSQAVAHWTYAGTGGQPRSFIRTETPVLVLIDGLLSQDDERVNTAVLEFSERLQSRYIHVPPLLASYRYSSSSSTGSSDDSSARRNPLEHLYELLDLFLSYFPVEAASRSDHDGSLPLHFCASFGDVQLANIVYQKYRAAASTPNDKGKIPLHYAAREGRVEMVAFFVQQQPHTASIFSHKKKLALHFAAGDGHTAVSQILLHAFPSGASLPSSKGKLALHFAARWGHLRIAQELLTVYPEAISTRDWEGSLPLHDACRQGQFDMARYLVERYPAALALENVRGEIPLFPAVRSRALDLVAYLIQAWPAGGRHVLTKVSKDDASEDWSWDTTELLLRGAVNRLHGCKILEGRERPSVCLNDDQAAAVLRSDRCNCTNKKKDKSTWKSIFRSNSPVLADSRKRVGEFYECAVANKRQRPCCIGSAFDITGDSKTSANSSSAVEGSLYKFIPLHAALECRASYPILSRVLQEREDDFELSDSTGRYPVHWAVATCGVDSDRVNCLLTRILPKTSAVVFYTRDEFGRLPLHIAIESRAHTSVISALLDACPDASIEPCQTRDEWHDEIPLLWACHVDCDLTSIYQLLRLNPGSLTQFQGKEASLVVPTEELSLKPC